MKDHRGHNNIKFIRTALIVVSSFLVIQGSWTQDRIFGLGLIVGEPAGISAKLWTSNTAAFDAGLGWSVGGDRIGINDSYYNGQSRVHIHVDYLRHSFDALSSVEQFPVYYGIGGRVNNGLGQDASFAFRGVFGIEWLPRSTPIDIFMELVPMFQITSSRGIGLDAGVGIRYFFGRVDH